MTLSIVDPNSSQLAHLTSVDVKFSGVHIGGGIYFSANHNPTPGGSSTAIPQRSLFGEVEGHATIEYDYTLPEGGEPWDAYRDDINGDGTLDLIKAGFDMSMHVGNRLGSTGEFYDGPAAPLLIANDANDLFGNVTITGYPSAANSLDGTNGTLHQTTGTLTSYTQQDVNGDIGGYFRIDDADIVGGMSGGGNYLYFDADGDGALETYLIATSARRVEIDRPGTNNDELWAESTSFAPHYAELAATIEGLTGDAARTADDFARMTLLSAQSLGSSLTTVNGTFFHEDIFGGINADTLFGGGGDDAIFGRDGDDVIDGGEGDDTLNGGDGNDTLTGGAGADFFTGFGGGFTDIITDFEADKDVIDLSDFFPTLDDVIAATVELGDGSIWINLPVAAGGGAVQVFDTSIADLTAFNVNVICFVAGTRVVTKFGLRDVASLDAGDFLLTLDGSFKPLVAVEKRVIGREELMSRPNLWPIEIASGSLGVKVPDDTLRVSPQHRILIDSPIADRLVGSMVLIAANKFIEADGVTQPKPEAGCTYVHLVFECHEVILSNGTWSESFYPGPEALNTVSVKSAERLLAIFKVNPQPAYPIIEGKAAKNIVARHIKNKRDFQRPKNVVIAECLPGTTRNYSALGASV